MFSPSDPNAVVVVANYGVLPSSDNGTHWQYLCTDALGIPLYAASTQLSLGISASGALVGVTAAGLSVSTDNGCNWSCEGGPLAGQSLVDLVVRPDSPSHVVALASTYLPTDGGTGAANTALFDAQVYETSNNGETWLPVGTPLPQDVDAGTIEVSRSDPARIYVSATRGFGPARTALLLVSRDRGETWAEKPLAAFDPAREDGVILGGIDPFNADVVYLRSELPLTGGEMRLFVSRDAGDTFSVPITASFSLPDAESDDPYDERLSFALSSDGSKVYVGTEEDGLWTAKADDLVFHQTNACLRVQCLATRATSEGDELWACSAAVTGFVAGVSADEGATFTPKLSTVSQLAGPIACGKDGGASLACGAETLATCGDAWNSFCDTYSCPPAGSSGYLGPIGTCSQDLVAPLADAGPSRPALVTAACGCSVPAGGPPGAPALAWLGGIVALRRRRSTRGDRRWSSR